MRYQFTDFTLDTDLFELSRAGRPIKAEPQVVELLLLLVRNSDRMVTKEEINDKVWHGRFVSEAALSSRIKTARRLLQDDGQSQRFIRTIHKKGFRFVGAVERIDGRELGPPADNHAVQGVHDVAGGAGRQTTRQEVARAYDGGVVPDNGKESVPERAQARSAVAVLPFVNLSGEPGQEYFSDGVTTDIMTRLSRHRWLDVIARNTAFGYRGGAVDMRGLRDALGVDYVIEGSVQRIGDHVRVTVQLIDARTAHSKWSERYDREIADLFSLQDDITETIVARLEPEIGFAERNRVIHARPANLQAWDCYHLGVFHLYKFTGADNIEAQRLLRQCQELDPLLGEAHAWWAYAVVLGMVYWDTFPSTKALDEALTACSLAVSLDPLNATFLALRGRVYLARCEYDMAIADNESAIALNPSFAAAHCGLGDSLAYERRYDEAIERFEKAITMSPNDPQLWAFLTYGALALIFKGDFDTAVQWTARANGLPNCQYWTMAHRAVAQVYQGRVKDARRTALRLLQDMPGFSCAFARKKLFYLKDRHQIAYYIEGLLAAGVPAN